MRKLRELRTVQDCLALRNELDNNRCNNAKYEIRLKNDIDFQNQTWCWEKLQDFSGNFDGEGHIIKNVVIVAPTPKKPFHITDSSVGFFPNLRGYVQNLNLNCTIPTGGSWTGGICGYNYGSILNCAVSGNIKGKSFSGGLSGGNWGDIVGCTNRADILTANFDYYTVSQNHFRLDQITGCNIRPMDRYKYGRVDNNFQKGSIAFPDPDDTFVTIYMRHDDYRFSGSELDQLLKHEQKPYRDSKGNTYLHLACKRFGRDRPDVKLKFMIERFAMCENIDFAAKNKFGKTAADYLRNEHGRAFPGCAKYIAEIGDIIQARGQEEEKFEDFSDIGF